MTTANHSITRRANHVRHSISPTRDNFAKRHSARVSQTGIQTSQEVAPKNHRQPRKRKQIIRDPTAAQKTWMQSFESASSQEELDAAQQSEKKPKKGAHSKDAGKA